MKEKAKDATTIMVIDDDEDLLTLTTRTLERAGFTVDARTSAPGWDDLERVDPALVFMDVDLKGENGVEVCQAIKSNARSATLPVILISGHERSRLQNEARECRADGYLTKPFSSRLLLDLAMHYCKAA